MTAGGAAEAYFTPLGSEGATAGEHTADDHTAEDPTAFGPRERFHAGALTVSTWGPELQHGAPPAALLTRALERCGEPGSGRLARIAVDLFGAVPLGEVATRARIVRPGRRIALVEAELEAGGRVVARASGWRLRTRDTTEARHRADPPRRPVETPVDPEFAARWAGGFIDSLEMRAEEPGVLWARTTHPLVEGEQMSPTVRLMSVADIANGVGAVLDPERWRFLNTELTVHLHTEPTGEWTGIAAEASIGPDGIGTTSGVLHDVEGPVGRIEQALLVEPVD